jgi:thiamine-monophosphate kinase
MRTDVNQLGEFGLIDHLTKNHILRNPSSIKGVGDDAAVIRNGDLATVVSTDFLIEGIHFDLAYTPLKHLGYKAVAVNVSDIAAMNAVCKQITVSIAFSNRFSVEALNELYEGIYAACAKYGVDVVGGDTTSAPKGLFISITAIGQAAEADIVYRNGAKPGDILCVTGYLGSAFLGLQILEREKQVYIAAPLAQPELEGHEHVVGALLKPEARVDMIKRFKEFGLKPTAMMDVSDGLASEIFHICKQSGTGAVVEEDQIPIHKDAYELAALTFQIDPTVCAMNGGEDYELLFTVSPDDLNKVREMPGIYIIGEIKPKEDGIQMHSKGDKFYDIEAQGWVHF